MPRTIVLERLPTTPAATLGFLTFPKHTLCTIERPWIPVDEHKGGRPFESCVPAGLYDLRPHTRSSGAQVLALENHDLSVYYSESEVPIEGGRYLILIHVANWVKDVVGCIGPGLSKTYDHIPMVTDSTAAMKQIMAYDPQQIDIRWVA